MYTQNEVKKVQKRLLEMAIAIRDILETNGIPYFITYGTLLGAIRHKGFIPWDDDFDFYLFDDTYNEAMNTLKKELPYDMFLENWDSEPKYFHAWAHVKDTNSLTECEMFPIDSHYQHKGISVDLYRTKLIQEKEEQVYRLSEHIAYLKRRRRHNLIEEELFKRKIEDLTSRLTNEQDILSHQKDLGRKMYAFSIIYNDRLYLDELFPLKKYRFENTEFYGPQKPEALLSRCYGNYMQLPPMEKRKPHYSNVTFL